MDIPIHAPTTLVVGLGGFCYVLGLDNAYTVCSLEPPLPGVRVRKFRICMFGIDTAILPGNLCTAFVIEYFGLYIFILKDSC